ncbi:MAG: alpha/beta fold hydrolase [Alphaproteobacteria bacterium]|nr:alpha/beta fold hydrolase [Alphaproteobacteria bacterium]
MPSDQPRPEYFVHSGPHLPRIAYRRIRGKSPGVVFCTGFMSDMTGSKALAVEAWAKANGQACLRFDYSGHGESEGKFADGTIGSWFADALGVFDAHTEGPQIVVGSSMGGWIGLLLARARPARVSAFVGIAAAPDFTEDLIWAKLPEALRAKLARDGFFEEPTPYGDTPYTITRKLIEEGRDHLLLRAPIGFDGPVRLLHGMRDPDVPWQWSPKIAERVTSADVKVTLVKDGDHRLSRDQDLALLAATLDELAR